MTMPQNSPRNKTNAFIGMVRQYSSSWPIGVNQSCGVLPANLALVLDVGTVLVSALLVTELCRFGTLPLHMGVSSFRPGLLFKILQCIPLRDVLQSLPWPLLLLNCR